MSERHRHAGFLIFGLILIAVTRAGSLGGSPLLDGDEAILGLMSRHVIEGQGLAIYYYGQSYGMAVLETLAVASSFLRFGASALALKVGILLLWSVGWLFFVAAARMLLGMRPAWIAGLLLALLPAWGNWATMGRGIYVGAFTLTWLCLWQVARLEQESPKGTAWLILGLSLGLLWLTNPVWLVSFSPFLFRLGFGRPDLKRWSVLTAGFAAALVGAAVASNGSSSYWSPDLFGDPGLVESAKHLPERILVCFGGIYRYSTPGDTGPFTATSAVVWSLVLLAGLGRLFRLARTRSMPSVGETSLLAALGAPLVSLFINPEVFGYRYLLPSAGFVILFVGAESAVEKPGSARRRGMTALVMTLGVLGLVSLAETSFRQHDERVAEITARSQLLQDLSAADVEAVYTLDPALQWLVIFGSGETIPARWVDPRDRRPEYPAAVDRVFFEGGRVAVVGRTEEWERATAILAREGLPVPELEISSDRFLWATAPSRALLDRLGFRLNDPGPPPP